MFSFGALSPRDRGRPLNLATAAQRWAAAAVPAALAACQRGASERSTETLTLRKSTQTGSRFLLGRKVCPRESSPTGSCPQWSASRCCSWQYLLWPWWVPRHSREDTHFPGCTTGRTGPWGLSQCCSLLSQEIENAGDWIPADTPRDSKKLRVAPPCCTRSQICVTVMKFPIPADTHSIPSHGIETGRKRETGCGARSSRDGFTADLECNGTHHNFPVTLESGEAIEDLAKDEVEQLVVMLRELVDVLCRRQEGELVLMVGTMIDRLISGDTGEITSDARLAIPRIHEFWCRRTQLCDIAADDSDSDEGGHGSSRPRHTISVRDSLQQQKRALAPSAGTFPLRRKAQWHFLRQWRVQVLWGGWGVRPRLLPGWKGRLAPRLRGEPGVRSPTLPPDTVLTLRERRHLHALVRRMPLLHVPWVPRRRGRRLAHRPPELLRGLTAPTHPAPSPIPLGALGRWWWGREVGGENGHPHPTEWMVLCGGVDLKAFTEGLGANFVPSSFFRTLTGPTKRRYEIWSLCVAGELTRLTHYTIPVSLFPFRE